MALSNKTGQQAFQNADPKINGEIIDAAEKATQPVEETVEMIAPAESELSELDSVIARPTASTAEETLDKASADFPTGGFSAVPSYTDKIEMLGKTGELEYPEYRTLSQQQRVSYVQAMESPEYQRLARQAAQHDFENLSSTTAKQVKNAMIRYIGDVLSADNAELWLGNMLATDDYGDLGELALQIGATAFGKLTGAIGMILSPSEIALDPLEQQMWQNANKIATFSGEPTEDTKLNTIGKDMVNSAMRNIEYKASVLPQGTPADQQAWATRITSGVNSMGELLLVGAGTKALTTSAVRSSIKTGRFRDKRTTVSQLETPTKTYAPQVADRYARIKGGQAGTVAATGVMTSDILGAGAFESIQKYIEETGDTDLSEYSADVKKIAIDAGSAAIQDWIEHRAGITKFIKDPRLATKYGEWANGLIQEFTQGEISDVAEYIKGNQTIQDVLANVGENAKDGIVGMITQGALGTGIYHYYHRKNVAELRDLVMSQNPNISYSEAEQFADKKVSELESGTVRDMVKDIVEFTDAQGYQGKIFETIQSNIKQAIDYQRNAVKDTIDGSKFDEMTEQELAQYIESTAQDQTDRVVIDALERKIPLSESEALKGETIDGTYYIEGSDYAKDEKARAEAERQNIRNQVYARRQAEKEAKATAREAQQAERTAQREAQKAAKLKEKSQADFLSGNAVYDAQGNRTMAGISELETMPEIRQRISVYNTLKDQIDLTDKQVDTLNNTVKRLERKLLKFQREAINTANGDQLAQFLKRNKVDVRYFTTTADYRKAALKIADKWDLDEEAVPTDKRAYRTPTAQLEQQIAQTEDLLLRAGLTREQIAVMSDEEYQAAIEATDEYKAMVAENAKIAELGAELEDVDIQFQDVANEMARLDSENPPYTGETINIDGVERTVYNSNGDRIAQSEPALRNFYAWFGDSQVVDRKRRPLVVYHGTLSEFDKFDRFRVGERTNISTRGFYFTPNEKMARTYGNIVMPLYLRATNMLEIDFQNADHLGRFRSGEYAVIPKDTQKNFNDLIEGFFRPRKMSYKKAVEFVENNPDYFITNQPYNNTPEISQIAKEYGFDGVIFNNISDALMGDITDTVFSVFEPNQIKSTDNRGTFSLETGNIYYQRQAQSGKGGAYDARNRSITLGAKADATTFPHEFAHYWIDKNFKWARSGNASTAWMRQWQAVEKWLGIDPEDKFLDKSASEKFARAYERFLADEQLPLVLQKSMADFRDYVLDHYDFDLDEAKGLQDKFGRPIVLDDSVKEWFRKSIYDEYTSPAESLVVDTRLDQMDTEAQVVKIVAASTNEIQDTAQESPIVESIPTGTEIQTEAGITNGDVLGKRKIGGGEMKESQGAIGQQIGATYESTTWEIQREMAKDYLSKVSIDEAIESLIDGTYPDKMDANFLRAELVERLNELGRFDEAAQLVVETSASLTAAAQELQGARATQTPFQMAIEQIVAIKTEKLARAKYGNNKKAVSKLDAALDKIIAKYEKQFLEATTDEEIDAIYDAIQADGVRAIGSLNKRPADDGLQFQTTEEKREQAKETKARKKRGSIKAYRSRAKALLKKSLGITPTKAQIREINRLSVDVSKAITEYRKKVRTDKASAIDSTPVLNAQNALNNYMVEQVGQSWLAKSADALNSYMMANMLWNPATQFKNIVGNTIQAIPHLLGSIAKYGNKGTLSMSDKMKILQNAIKTQATTGYNIFSIEDIFSKKTLWAEKYYEPTSGAGKFIRAPLTLLGLSDTVFKGFVFLNHADIMATNIARGEAKANGWNAEQTKARAKELFYQALNTDPTTITNIGAKIRSESLVEGAQATFTEDTKLAHYANQFRSMLNFGAKTGIGNLLIPFTSTIANIAQDAVANYTFGSIKEAIKNPSFVIQALNPMIDSEMRKEAWKTIAPEYKNLIKNAMGMLMLIWLAVCYSDDEDFVLDYNLQTEKDKDIRQNRNAPYGTAVRIGDKWVQIDIAGSAFLPLQTVLTARRHGFTADGWIKGIAGWRDLIPGVGEIESLVEEYNKTVQFNKGSDLVAVETMLTDQGTEIITRLIPAAALVNQIGNITDVSKREKYNRWYDRILGRIPGVRERLPEATSKTTGKVIPQTDVLANLISGGNIRDYVAPSVSDQARYEFLDADRGLAFRESNSRLKELGKDSKAFKQAVQKVRSRFNDRLSVLVRNPAYKAMDIEEKRKAAVQLHSQIVDQIANEYGIKKKKALKKTKK